MVEHHGRNIDYPLALSVQVFDGEDHRGNGHDLPEKSAHDPEPIRNRADSLIVRRYANSFKS
jgi:hypothetical protein